MSSTPGAAIGSTSRPADVEPALGAPSVEQRDGRGVDGSSPTRPSATPPRSLLWARPSASSLSATGPAERVGRPPTAASASGDGDRPAVTAMPARREAARGSRARAARARTAARAAARGRRCGSSRRTSVRSAASAGHAGPPRPARRRAVAPASQRATDAIAVNASTAPRSSGAPPPSLVEQRLRLGRRLARGQRDVDGRIAGPVARSRRAAATSRRARSRPRTAASGTGSRGRARARRRRPTPPSPRSARRRRSAASRRPTGSSGLPT